MDDLPPEFDRPFTTQEFLDIRLDLPEIGQWAELAAGRIELLPAPTTEESDVVGNLSTTLSEFVTASPGAGMPLFRKPLEVATHSVRAPAMSWVEGAASFSAIDADVLTEPPAWVVEQAGNRIIRERMTDRVRDYLAWGVRLVWVVDPVDRSLFAITPDGSTQLSGTETVVAKPVTAFSVTLERLFQPPKGWERPQSGDADSSPGDAASNGQA